MSILNLPPEILRDILMRLTSIDWHSAALVCRTIWAAMSGVVDAYKTTAIEEYSPIQTVFNMFSTRDDCDICANVAAGLVATWDISQKPTERESVIHDVLRIRLGLCVARIKYASTLDGLLHSFNGKPALITTGNTRVWASRGIVHNDKGPAVMTGGNGGSVAEIWYTRGLPHRDNGSAVTIRGYFDESIEWWRHGQRHRDGDLPALCDAGRLVWYKNGMVHRDGDMPAFIDIPELEGNVEMVRVMATGQIPIELTDGNVCAEWWWFGRLHRNSRGQAAVIERFDGLTTKEWWKNGEQTQSGICLTDEQIYLYLAGGHSSVF